MLIYYLLNILTNVLSEVCFMRNSMFYQKNVLKTFFHSHFSSFSSRKISSIYIFSYFNYDKSCEDGYIRIVS